MSEQWLVVGAGAVGMRWTAKLMDAGNLVTLVHRVTPKESTFETESKDGDVRRYSPKNATASELTDKYRHILICTKAYDAVSAYQSIRNATKKDAQIICLINGFGPQLELAQKLKASQSLFAGVTSEGTLKLNKNKIRLTGEGDTFIGPLNDHAENTLHPLPNFRCSNILQRLIEKLAINTAINPLTAILDITNGELLNPPYSRLFDAVIDEIKASLEHPSFPYQGEALKLDLDHLHQRIETVARLTALNYSSMHQDIRMKRQTESNFICGYFYRLTSAHTPIIDMMHEGLETPGTIETTKQRLLTLFT